MGSLAGINNNSNNNSDDDEEESTFSFSNCVPASLDEVIKDVKPHMLEKIERLDEPDLKPEEKVKLLEELTRASSFLAHLLTNPESSENMHFRDPSTQKLHMKPIDFFVKLGWLESVSENFWNRVTLKRRISVDRIRPEEDNINVLLIHEKSETNDSREFCLISFKPTEEELLVLKLYKQAGMRPVYDHGAHAPQAMLMYFLYCGFGAYLREQNNEDPEEDGSSDNDDVGKNGEKKNKICYHCGTPATEIERAREQADFVISSGYLSDECLLEELLEEYFEYLKKLASGTYRNHGVLSVANSFFSLHPEMKEAITRLDAKKFIASGKERNEKLKSMPRRNKRPKK